MNLSVYFDIARDQDLAAVDVQNQVKLAEPQLPQEVRQNGITVKKAQTRHPAGGGPPLERPPVRRRLPDQLCQDLRRGRAQAAAWRG